MLGSTGSIGVQTLEIVQNDPDNFRIITLACNQNIEILKTQIRQFHPLLVSVGSAKDALKLANEFSNSIFVSGDEGLVKAATYDESDQNGLLVNALVGIAGLKPTIEAIKCKRNIALANKETLVVGGVLVKKLLEEFNVKLYPIDSEHSGLWQCLDHEDLTKIKKLYITASGGAFRDYSRENLESVIAEDALKHPNWQMGKKITIDSATMMNKGFEMIEACHLFDISIDKIEPVLHKESLVHAMVEFVDNSIIMQMSSHDMKLPISYALYYPERTKNVAQVLDVCKLKDLHFSQFDHERYPLLLTAVQAFKSGGTLPCVLNAANEAAVDLFLRGKIAFLEIETIITESLKKHEPVMNPTLEDLLLIDKIIKKTLYQKYDY